MEYAILALANFPISQIPPLIQQKCDVDGICFRKRSVIAQVAMGSKSTFGALVLSIKPKSSLPVLQIPILHYEINYG